MDVSDFDFELPAELIAQTPAAERGTSKLLVLQKATGQITHAAMTRLSDFLRPGDLLVVNDTKVFPARLLGTRVPSGGAVECLLLARLPDAGPSSADMSSEQRWEALMHPGQKLRPGAKVMFRGGQRVMYGEVLDRHFYGRRTIRLWTEDGARLEDTIDAIGHVPLPPYIKRADESLDLTRYQTVYARQRGSVAAPTAGLHFTSDLLSELERKGVEGTTITLHVGYGTFKPVRATQVEAHTVDAETYAIGDAAAEAVNRAKREGRRVVAVGTTTTRALESAASQGGVIKPQSAATELFIYPGFNFRIVDALMTNFHLPQSSLLMLVSAFAGREVVLGAYREAVARRYRFYSYGDAMLII